MAERTKIEQMETLARERVGDGQTPDLFFVSLGGVIATITRSFDVAYAEWHGYASRFPREESALEDRLWGVICDVSPEGDPTPENPRPRLYVTDDSEGLRALYPDAVGERN